jgi:prevent-host-death family protein
MAVRHVTGYHGHMEISAGKFKATCLKLMDRVAATGEPIVITKRGKPLAKLVPVREDKDHPRSGIGSMAGTILYLAPDEELYSPAGDVRWNAQG